MLLRVIGFPMFFLGEDCPSRQLQQTRVACSTADTCFAPEIHGGLVLQRIFRINPGAGPCFVGEFRARDGMPR